MKDNRQSGRRGPSPLSRLLPGKVRVGADQRDAALELAVAALGFIAGERDELSRFLALTGIDHRSIRTAAEEPGFLSGVLAYIAGHEQTLLAFAAYCGRSSRRDREGRIILAGAEWERDTP